MKTFFSNGADVVMIRCYEIYVRRDVADDNGSATQMTTDAGLQHLRGLSACEKEKDRLLFVSEHITDITVNET